ncbi:MAG: exostosin family protein [Acetobacteraceae bacterium]|nr:exostosin family protein [Acetobacteraceae bacterium]
MFVTAYRNDEAEKVAQNLRRLHGASNGLHELAADPQSASIIMIGGIGNEMRQRDYLLQTLNNRLIDAFARKCFTFSYRDTPVVFNRGVYESATTSRWAPGRCSAGTYALSGHFNGKIGAMPVAGKYLLFSFIGRISHKCRAQILTQQYNRRDIVLEDTSQFHYWTAPDHVRDDRESHFASVLSRSKFCLCPRGVGTGSIRLFEAMRAGVAPVVIADRWVRPMGIAWDEFSIFVGENDLRSLERRIVERERDFAAMGNAARRAWDAHFSEPEHFNYLVDVCVTMMREQRIPESAYWASRHLIASTAVATNLGRRLRRA